MSEENTKQVDKKIPVALSRKVYSAFIIISWEQKESYLTANDTYLYVVGHFSSEEKAKAELDKSKDFCRTSDSFIANLMDYLLSGFTVKIKTDIKLMQLNLTAEKRDHNNVYRIKGYKGLTNNLALLDQIEIAMGIKRELVPMDTNIFNPDKAENVN